MVIAGTDFNLKNTIVNPPYSIIDTNVTIVTIVFYSRETKLLNWTLLKKTGTIEKKINIVDFFATL